MIRVLCLYIIINALMVLVGWALPTICRAEPDLHFGSGPSGLGNLYRGSFYPFLPGTPPKLLKFKTTLDAPACGSTSSFFVA